MKKSSTFAPSNKKKGKIMELKVYNDVDKVFTCGQILITRQDFENVPGMLMAELCDDDTMQKIVNDTCKCLEKIYNTLELEMYKQFEIGNENSLSRNEIIRCVQIELYAKEVFEKFALGYGMRYWHDLTDEEQDYLIKNYNF